MLFKQPWPELSPRAYGFSENGSVGSSHAVCLSSQKHLCETCRLNTDPVLNWAAPPLSLGSWQMMDHPLNPVTERGHSGPGAYRKVMWFTREKLHGSFTNSPHTGREASGLTHLISQRQYFYSRFITWFIYSSLMSQSVDERRSHFLFSLSVLTSCSHLH